MYNAATEQQKEALEKLGVVPPPSKTGCSNLLRYLIGSGGVDRERVALIVSEQKRFQYHGGCYYLLGSYQLEP